MWFRIPAQVSSLVPPLLYAPQPLTNPVPLLTQPDPLAPQRIECRHSRGGVMKAIEVGKGQSWTVNLGVVLGKLCYDCWWPSRSASDCRGGIGVHPWWAENSEGRGIEALSESLEPSACSLHPGLPSPILVPFKERWWDKGWLTPLGDIFLPDKHMDTQTVCFILLINLIFRFV